MTDDFEFGETVRGYAAGQQVFGRYTLRKLLGRGGMGVVWLAVDNELEREVALKFLPEVVAHDAQSVQDLKRETRRSLELTHANIVRIHDFIQDGQAAAISMEFVDGPSLASHKVAQPEGHFDINVTASGGQMLLSRRDPLIGWIEQLCDALHYAHTQAQVVHRDLKPANLMIDARGNLKIADFGIAASVSDSVSRVSQSAGSSGTPVYMSPQQMMGEPPAVTDDVYSLGATLYELLTGRPPFYSGNVMMQVMNKVPPTMAERRQQLQVSGKPIPEAWERVVARCLAKEPGERPESVQAVKTALLGGGSPAPATATAPTEAGAPQQGSDLQLDVPLTEAEMSAGCQRRVDFQKSGESIEVKIPPGVAEGTRIRLRGRGDAGVNGGARGDLYLRVVRQAESHTPSPAGAPSSGGAGAGGTAATPPPVPASPPPLPGDVGGDEPNWFLGIGWLVLIGLAFGVFVLGAVTGRSEAFSQIMEAQLVGPGTNPASWWGYVLGVGCLFGLWFGRMPGWCRGVLAVGAMMFLFFQGIWGAWDDWPPGAETVVPATMGLALTLAVVVAQWIGRKTSARVNIGFLHGWPVWAVIVVLVVFYVVHTMTLGVPLVDGSLAGVRPAIEVMINLSMPFALLATPLLAGGKVEGWLGWLAVAAIEPLYQLAYVGDQDPLSTTWFNGLVAGVAITGLIVWFNMARSSGASGATQSPAP